jgi:hypothetical protein
MTAHGAANTVNALSKLDAAARAMLPAEWDAVARAAERTAPTMNTQGAANTVNALSKLDVATKAMSPAGWDAVAKVAEHTAPTINAQTAANTLNALSTSWSPLTGRRRQDRRPEENDTAGYREGKGRGENNIITINT